MQCFQTALAFIVRAISYAHKMFMTSTPGVSGSWPVGWWGPCSSRPRPLASSRRSKAPARQRPSCCQCCKIVLFITDIPAN
jgi:hypothetical protein